MDLENRVALTAEQTEGSVPQQLPAFTPGPWKVVADHPQNACVYVTASSYYDQVATCYGGGEAERGENGAWGPHPIRDANARLIAAAPDMYEALEEIADLFERAGKLHPTRDLREVISDPAHLAIRARTTLSRIKSEG